MVEGREERCQTVFSQLEKCLPADGKHTFLANSGSWSFGKPMSNVFISQCSLWTNGKLIFPFVQVMRRVMTNGKLVCKGLVQGTTFVCHNDFNEGHDMAIKLCMKHQNLVEAACGCRWCCAKGPIALHHFGIDT